MDIIQYIGNIKQLLNICKTKCFDEKSNFRIQITFSKSTSVHKTHYYLLEFLHNDNVFGLYLSDNELEKFIFFIKEVINIDII
ncbi:MAG: hypothetical protein LC122_14160 [Chitinophagales bacterium]|nr:hypothetical protein [Chitinophagales bacterium]